MLAAASAAALSHAAQAQNTVGDQNPGDLILGFTGGANNYIADLGQLTGGHQDLSGGINLATFNAAGYSTGASISGKNAGFVGSDIGLDPRTYIFATVAHGSGAPPTPTAQGSIQQASGNVSAVLLGNVSPSDAQSWSQLIAQNSTTAGGNGNNFTQNAAVNPLQTFNGTVLVEDLWKNDATSGAQPWTELGTLTLNFGGATPTVTFDPVAVPEPATYGILAGAGLLALSVRRQLGRKSA